MASLFSSRFANIANNQIHTSLDIGSGKVSCLIAKINNAGSIEIIGAGHQESKGLSSGNITDLEELESSIRKCVESAEKMAAETARSVILSFSSGKPEARILKIDVELQGSVVTEKDLEKVYDSLRGQNTFVGKKILHVVPLQFSIDGSKGIKNPIDMYGEKLSLDVSIISVEENAVKNFYRVVNKADLEVSDIIFSPYACGLSVLDEEERDLGVALVDIGYDLTTVSIFINKAIVSTSIIPLGGALITKDIAKIFSLSIVDAEKIKIINGQLIEGAVEGGATIEAKQLGGDNELLDPIEVSRAHLTEIIKPRVQEILETVREEILKSGYNKLITNRVVFTGGASQMDGLLYLGSEVLDKKSRLGRPKLVSGLPDNMSGSAFSTVNGLLKYISTESNDLKPKIVSNNRDEVNIVVRFNKFKKWILENF